MIVGGAAEAVVFPVPECVVPEGLDGPVHLFITSSATPLASNIVTQDGSSIVAGMSSFLDRAKCFHADPALGPAIAFIDSIPNVLAEVSDHNHLHVCSYADIRPGHPRRRRWC